MSEEFDAIDELGKATHMPPKSTRDVLIVDPGRIAELEAEVERLRHICAQVRELGIELAGMGLYTRGERYSLFWQSANELLRSARETENELEQEGGRLEDELSDL